MFCFEILSVDQELATSVATVDSRFVSPVTELLAPPIVSFGHFNHLRFPLDFFLVNLKFLKEITENRFHFAIYLQYYVLILMQKNCNEEYI